MALKELRNRRKRDEVRIEKGRNRGSALVVFLLRYHFGVSGIP